MSDDLIDIVVSLLGVITLRTLPVCPNADTPEILLLPSGNRQRLVCPPLVSTANIVSVISLASATVTTCGECPANAFLDVERWML